MILSFHPLITGDENINCAGRPPGAEEREAVFSARAVIVPQGVREDLYRLCRSACPLVWPNYDPRFDYPGKVGQALLFAAHGLARPRTVVFPSVEDFNRRRGGALALPCVLKASHGGEGGGVFPVYKRSDLKHALKILAREEAQGRGGFIQQEMIEHGGRDLRVVLVGGRTVACWRWAPPEEGFLTNLSSGGRLDFDSDPDLIELGVRAVREFGGRSGINLAGFDLMFDRRSTEPRPLFIEINYYFGRRALGGSRGYYRLLRQAANRWLKDHGLKRGPVRSRPKYTARD